MKENNIETAIEKAPETDSRFGNPPRSQSDQLPAILRWLLVNSGETRRMAQKCAWDDPYSSDQPGDYPPAPAHVRRHCLVLGSLPSMGE
jgi:hypothetical protein